MKKKKDVSWPRLIGFALSAIIFAGICSCNWFQFMLIKGKSMEPVLHNLQLVLLQKNPDNICRGDLIAFRCERLSDVLVKRVIAVPDDTAVIQNGHLYVDGNLSSVIPFDVMIKYAGLMTEPICLLEGQYLVLGDNIEYSVDSRYESVGVVSQESIIGKILH